MASNTLSINKIIGMFEDIASRHLMIHAFSYGPISDINTEGELKMPYLHIENTTSVLSRGTGVEYREVYYDFDIYVMDRINKGDSNYQDTTSDTLFILHSIIAEISQHPYYVDAGLKLVNDIQTESVFEATDENVNGHRATLRFKQGFRYTPCTIPIADIGSYSFNLNGVTEIVMRSGATGPQGPEGPQGATGPGMASISSASTGTNVTGSVNNTFSKALFVPANSFKTDDCPQVFGRTIRTGVSNASYVTRIYWNTTPDISGTPILIGQISAVAQASVAGQFVRTLGIVSDTNNTTVWPTNVSAITDVTTSTTAFSSIAIDWTQNGYIVIAIQLNNSADNAACRLIKIN